MFTCQTCREEKAEAEFSPSVIRYHQEQGFPLSCRLSRRRLAEARAKSRAEAEAKAKDQQVDSMWKWCESHPVRLWPDLLVQFNYHSDRFQCTRCGGYLVLGAHFEYKPGDHEHWTMSEWSRAGVFRRGRYMTQTDYCDESLI